MGQAKQDAEREFNRFDVQEKLSGKKLYEVYCQYHSQYCAPWIADWAKLDVKFKLAWTRTAKAVKYAL